MLFCRVCFYHEDINYRYARLHFNKTIRRYGISKRKKQKELNHQQWRRFKLQKKNPNSSAAFIEATTTFLN
ncbi:hypothetical protein FRACYDRAFT_271145 [Fragilariopsis cylindrus CCMP1102]|uniref:Uncharacterized protein n=1 Tax=Fragilariopsis cylindrus CCMP1102 TaxID=635003 RepID=A0A1E7EX94_9STRA|nr:hypothetical protein FRACYDRAFT_271145 [Fragilariopsis cylindrus CCMP1102]|eukprot:OEU10435.1 hypothetical protein FRACYDRAFT_271145 [Fragilariopsis cylindrus CCMP1102]